MKIRYFGKDKISVFKLSNTITLLALLLIASPLAKAQNPQAPTPTGFEHMHPEELALEVEELFVEKDREKVAKAYTEVLRRRATGTDGPFLDRSDPPVEMIPDYDDSHHSVMYTGLGRTALAIYNPEKNEVEENQRRVNPVVDRNIEIVTEVITANPELWEHMGPMQKETSIQYALETGKEKIIAQYLTTELKRDEPNTFWLPQRHIEAIKKAFPSEFTSELAQVEERIAAAQEDEKARRIELKEKADARDRERALEEKAGAELLEAVKNQDYDLAMKLYDEGASAITTPADTWTNAMIEALKDPNSSRFLEHMAKTGREMEIALLASPEYFGDLELGLKALKLVLAHHPEAFDEHAKSTLLWNILVGDERDSEVKILDFLLNTPGVLISEDIRRPINLGMSLLEYAEEMSNKILYTMLLERPDIQIGKTNPERFLKSSMPEPRFRELSYNKFNSTKRSNADLRLFNGCGVADHKKRYIWVADVTSHEFMPIRVSDKLSKRECVELFSRLKAKKATFSDNEARRLLLDENNLASWELFAEEAAAEGH